MKISIVISLFEEEGNIRRIEKEIPQALDSINTIEDYEVICINDGSRDNTLNLLKQIKHPKFRIFSHAKRYGLTAGIRSGVRKAKYDYIGYIDADLQTNPKDFGKLIEWLPKGFDAVSGRRMKRNVGLVKKLSSKIGHWAVGFFLKTELKDTNCPLQIFPKKTISKVLHYNNFHRFLSYLIEFQGYKVKEVPIKHYARKAGEAYSGFGVWRRTREGVKLLYVIGWMRKNLLKVKLKEVKALDNEN